MIRNHGPLLLASDWWQSPAAQGGLFALSCHAGALRLLVPRSREGVLNDLRLAEKIEVRVSCDGSMTLSGWPGMPLVIQPEDVSGFQAENHQEWIFAAYTAPRRDRPHKALERPAWVL